MASFDTPLLIGKQQRGIDVLSEFAASSRGLVRVRAKEEMSSKTPMTGILSRHWRHIRGRSEAIHVVPFSLAATPTIVDNTSITNFHKFNSTVHYTLLRHLPWPSAAALVTSNNRLGTEES